MSFARSGTIKPAQNKPPNKPKRSTKKVPAKRPSEPPVFDVDKIIASCSRAIKVTDLAERLQRTNINLRIISPLDQEVDVALSEVGITDVWHIVAVRMTIFRVQCAWEEYQIDLKFYNADPYDAERCKFERYCFSTSQFGIPSRILDFVFKK